MAKIKSTAVKVFPSAFRGLATGTKYNPEARLNTEFNVTNLINRLASKDSFVISWNPGTNVIIFNIHGYYFENNLTEFLSTGAGSTWTNVYASIKLLPFQTTDSENTSYKALTLVGTDDTGDVVTPSSGSTGRILDVTVSGVDTFQGVDLHNTPVTPATGVYELHLLTDGPSAWTVPTDSLLKFKATDVEGLPTINNSQTATTSSTIFAPVTAGVIDQILVSEGSTNAPTWKTPSNITVGKATQLETSRSLWGKSFNGTAAISGDISNTGNITPTTTNTSTVGTLDKTFANVFSTTFTGNLTGDVTGNVVGYVTGTASGNLTPSSTLNASKLSGTIPANVVQAEWDAAYTHSGVTTGSVHGSTTAGSNLLRLTNPSVISFPRINADNTVTARTVSDVKTDLSLNNVTNESKATMFTNPTFTGTVSGVTAAMVGLGNVTNESKATMFTDPTFTGTVSGVTAAMVGLGNVTDDAQVTSVTADSPLASSGGTTPKITVATGYTIPTSTEKGNYDSAYTATNAATPSSAINTIVKRDGSGNFSAGTITADLTGTATNATNTSFTRAGWSTANINGTIPSLTSGTTYQFYVDYNDNQGTQSAVINFGVCTYIAPYFNDSGFNVGASAFPGTANIYLLDILPSNGEICLYSLSGGTRTRITSTNYKLKYRIIK